MPIQVAVPGADLQFGWQAVEHARVPHQEEARGATPPTGRAHAVHESRIQAAHRLQVSKNHTFHFSNT